MTTPMQEAMIRENVKAFLRQEGDSATTLMPFDPKRLLALLDTIDELRQQIRDHGRSAGD